MIYSTVSFKRRLYRMVGVFLTFVILLAASAAVFADKPPDELFQHVTTTSQLVHRGDCDVKSMKKKGVPCLIFYNAAKELVWLVLFDKKNGQLAVTHVISVHDERETTRWCRQDVCL